MSSLSNYLFVYGTLLKDAENPMSLYLNDHSDYLGEGYMSGELYKVDFYPGAVYIPSTGKKVFGEIYQLREVNSVLEVLDTYEDFDPAAPEQSLFVREIVPVYHNGQQVKVWVYLYNHPVENFQKVESGIWGKI